MPVFKGAIGEGEMMALVSYIKSLGGPTSDGPPIPDGARP